MLCHTNLKGQLTSGNPIIKHIRTADPSAQVWDDGKVWVYTSHDQNNATDYSTMDGYHVFSSSDMIEWTDHGEILHSRDVSWGITQGGFMFAPDAAYKDGVYYLYFPHMAMGWKWVVGVATSDKPEGPFTDVGHYIEGTNHIDPTCFIDEDGEAYLIWGGDKQGPYIARLKENMTELAEEPRIIDYGGSNFGEGPFMHKRNDIYYFSYTCNTCFPYQGYYAMADNPYGPFDYKGDLKKSPPGAQDHHSMIEYHGQWYYFYHTGDYGPDASLFRRNVCVDSLYYNEDGTMQEVIGTSAGVGQDAIGKTPGLVIPGRIQAEDYFRTGDNWLEYVLEILGTEEYQMEIKGSDFVPGSKIYVLIDENIQDSILIEAAADTLRTSLELKGGKHTLKLLFSSGNEEVNLMNIDWIDLRGKMIYYSITASVTEGGSIEPEGLVYVPVGDSVEFVMDWGLNYEPDLLLVDGDTQIYTSKYVFYDVSDNHSIEVHYTACEGSFLNPLYQVNDEALVNSSEVSAMEGDDLKLLPEYEDAGELTWLDPNGMSSIGPEFSFEELRLGHAGTYSAYLTNSQGCKNNLDFTVFVEPFVLDVFEAERWLGKAGILNEACSDLGGGLNIGFIENNDWSSYEIDIDETGIYDFTARVATGAGGGSIELSIDGKILATVNVDGSSSEGWQDWYTTTPHEVEFETGEHELRLTYKGGEGYLFNLNWFDLEFNRAAPVSIHERHSQTDPEKLFSCYPHHDSPGYEIKYSLDQSSDVSLEIISMAGISSRTLMSSQAQEAGSYSLHWNGENDQGALVPEGVYLLVYSADHQREVQKVLFLK